MNKYSTHIKNHQYSRFLISVHFEQSNGKLSVEEMDNSCLGFLKIIGNMAHEDNHKLRASYSIVVQKSLWHAHFALSWLPIVSANVKTQSKAKDRINREDTISALIDCGFYVDNRLQAIKVITHDKKFVTDYVLFQPKLGQNVFLAGFYVHEVSAIFRSNKIDMSYSSGSFFAGSGNDYSNLMLIVFIILFFLICLGFLPISDPTALLR